MDNNLSTPLVSVLMLVYNGESFLHESISSILNQSYSNWELIVIDDCSTDKSVSIIESFNDIRIRFFKNEKKQCLSALRNFGIDNAKGMYIATLDCDDVALFNRFETQIAFMESNPDIGVCGTFCETFGEVKGQLFEYKTLDQEIKYQMFINSHFANSSTMIRLNVLRTNNIRYDANYLTAEDYNLWIQLAKVTMFANIPQVLVKYRIHSTQTSQNSNIRKYINDNRLLYLTLFISDFNKKDLFYHVRFTKSQMTFYNEKNIKELHDWLIKFTDSYKSQLILDKDVLFIKASKYWNEIISNFYFKEYTFGIFLLLLRSKLTDHDQFCFKKKILFIKKIIENKH